MSENSLKVFKFGGASMKNAAAIRNVAHIIGLYPNQSLLVVVSAMGKTTNALEEIVNLAAHHRSFATELQQLKDYHFQVVNELFTDPQRVRKALEQQFGHLEKNLNLTGEFDMVYDQVVSLGEVLSSVILYHVLAQQRSATWLDARDCVVTDANFREGRVDWNSTRTKIAALRDTLNNRVAVTQGFIGRTNDGLTTTLGREGSDYSAAIFASSLEAQSVTIWKDVPGVMNADPRKLPAAVVFDELPFKEAAEMTYYGASVIHPKTIKPLANKGIPLLVKNFVDPGLPGTRITECKVESLPPLIVFKENQCLITCKVTDYTFVNEEQLSKIFQALAQLDVKINLMQNSAITFSFCVDYRESKVMKLIDLLGHHFEVYYNTGLTLITVKNYDAATFAEYRSKAGVLLEQSSRSTLQVLLKHPL